MSIIWGLDPAFRNFGAAVLSTGGIMPRQGTDAATVCRVDVAVTKPSAKKHRVLAADDDARCIRELARFLDELHDEFTPVAICAEVASGAKSAKAARMLGAAHAVMVTFAELRRIPLAICTPQALKKATTGKLSATKDEVEAAVTKRFGDVLSHLPKTKREHAADALGAFIACEHSDIIRAVTR